MIRLPIDDVLPELAAKLRASGAVVLQAPTGAGKTTRVPPAIVGAKQTLLLEPRRVAARAAARRMAIESDTPLGGQFGYHVRFDRKSSNATKVIAVTPGILLRQLQDDPFLENVDAVVFDEFHERGLESDLALGLVKLLRQTVRPDLRVVVMSATLDVNRIANYLGDCPVVVSEGRSFPVEIRYSARRRDVPMVDAAAIAVGSIFQHTTGDVLVFLPGLGEIRQLEERLLSLDALILPLHGELPPEEQDRALVKHPRRKIVLATNVAETSVTVEGVTAVIDTGQARQMEFDTAVGMNRLSLKPISQASADQRAGRAGRTRPGVCVRLWDEFGHRARPQQTEPEIRRLDLAPAVLQLLAMGEEPKTFPWLDAPKLESIEQAMTLLSRLGAYRDGALTEVGRAMAEFPVHPRLARMLIECPSEATALAAAILSERDPFDRERAPISTRSDLIDRVEALTERNLAIPRGTVQQILKARDQLVKLLPRTTEDGRPWKLNDLLRAIYVAFPDRLCRRRGRNDRRALMVGGRGVKLAPSSGVIDPDLFVALDVDAGGVEAFVRIASEVKREWLDCTVQHEHEFDGEKVNCFKRSRFEGLAIDETAGHIDDEVAATILAEEALKAKIAPDADSAAGRFLIRWRCLRDWQPDWELPEPNLNVILPSLCLGCRSFNDLKKAYWLEAIRGSMSWTESQRIEKEAPESITVPGGRVVTLQYELGRAPVLAAKIQELFGLKETPRIAGGAVKVLIHLLAPNGRPQQVTDDLANFWANTYAVVRKELRGRYPKHDWPEDPTTATASRGVRKKPASGRP